MNTTTDGNAPAALFTLLHVGYDANVTKKGTIPHVVAAYGKKQSKWTPHVLDKPLRCDGNGWREYMVNGGSIGDALIASVMVIGT